MSKEFINKETGSVFSPEDIDNMLRKVIEDGKGLSSWEENFIASVTDQFNRTSNLSEKQVEVLERIYTDRTK